MALLCREASAVSLESIRKASQRFFCNHTSRCIPLRLPFSEPLPCPDATAFAGQCHKLATLSATRCRGSAAARICSAAAETDDISAIAETAVLLARQAGELLTARSGRESQVEAKEVRSDLVTEVDRASEALIRNGVQAAFPGHRFVGEETATAEDLKRLDNPDDSTTFTWIVDPIDGTLNFVADLPFSVVAIGVARAGLVEVGVVYNPFLNEMFVARRGKGATLNGAAISVCPRDTELEDATISAGFPAKDKDRADLMRAVLAVTPHVRSMRMLGSAALQMSYVAAGKLGCFFEVILKPWDIAGARLIVEEAGGLVTDMVGRPLPMSGGSVLASNGGDAIHRRVVELFP